MKKIYLLFLLLAIAINGLIAQNLVYVKFDDKGVPAITCQDEGLVAEPTMALLSKATDLLIKNGSKGVITPVVKNGDKSFELSPIEKDKEQKFSLTSGKLKDKDGNEQQLEIGFQISSKEHPKARDFFERNTPCITITFEKDKNPDVKGFDQKKKVNITEAFITKVTQLDIINHSDIVGTASMDINGDKFDLKVANKGERIQLPIAGNKLKDAAGNDHALKLPFTVAVKEKSELKTAVTGSAPQPPATTTLTITIAADEKITTEPKTFAKADDFQKITKITIDNKSAKTQVVHTKLDAPNSPFDFSIPAGQKQDFAVKDKKVTVGGTEHGISLPVTFSNDAGNKAEIKAPVVVVDAGGKPNPGEQPVTTNASECAPRMLNSDFSFIPDVSTRKSWHAQAQPDALPPLVKHTRYLLEYNYSKPAPDVEVWKRSIRLYNQDTFQIKRYSNRKLDQEPKKKVVVHTDLLDYHPVRKSKMFPTVDRNVLVYLHGFHPYRDSFTIAMNYEDRFLENSETFTNVLGSFGAAPAEQAQEAATTEKATNETVAESTSYTFFQLFAGLSKQLEELYTTQRANGALSPFEAATAVEYVKLKITEAFPGFTNFSQSGFSKYAEDKAQCLSAEDKGKLKEYFNNASLSGYYFALLSSYTNYQAHSILIKNRDALSIDVDHFQNGKLLTEPNVEKNRMYHIRGGCKLDFSVGIFANALVDKEFTTQSVSAPDTTFLLNSNGTHYLPDSITAINRDAKKDSIIKDSKGKFNLGPAVFAHLYIRTGSRVNASLTFGFALNQSARPFFLTGASLLIGMGDGNRSRLALTAGCAFGTVKELEAGYKEGDKIVLSALPNSKIPTKDVWRANWFFGVSFNIGGVKIGGNGGGASKSNTKTKS